MFSLGLYNKDSIYDLRDLFNKSFASVFIVLPIIIIVTSVAGIYTYPAPGGRVILYLLINIALPAMAIVAGRVLVLRLFDLEPFKRRILVVGSGPRAQRVINLIRRTGHRDLSQRQGPLDDQAVDDEVDEIVLALEDQRGMAVEELLRCKFSGIAIKDYWSFIEQEAGRIDLDALRPSWFIFSDGFSQNQVLSVVKRLVDIAISVAFLVFTLPVIALTALAIRIESPGPVLFRQERVGQQGRSFTLIKFRSMQIDAEADGPRWAQVQDRRVTMVGAIIRQTRIDEIPQVLNVLKGDMSFVGPRPERPFFVQGLAAAIPYYNERHRVKPGITGWAQINYPYGASIDDAKAKLSYDLYYIKNQSLFIDLVIILQTIRVILFRSGAR